MKIKKILFKDLPIDAFFRFEALSHNKELDKNIFQKKSNGPLDSIWVMDNTYKVGGYTKVVYGSPCCIGSDAIVVRVYPNRFTLTEKM